MRDPYLYEDVPVLINKLGIKDQETLDGAEGDYVSLRISEIALNGFPGDYHTDHLLGMHEFIFQDIYEWAGQPRTISIYKEEDVLGGQSIEYSDPFDIIHDIHNVLSDMRSKKWAEMDHDSITIEFCDTLARLWKIHPFREGNTRTTVTFCCQFIDEQGFNINRKLFEGNARFVRTALVAYNAYFNDGNDFSKKEYLQKIVYDSFKKCFS